MKAWRIEVPLLFPEGVAALAERQGSTMIIARDGQGRSLLRGTAVAGAVRAAFAERLPKDVDAWFGEPLLSEDDVARASWIVVEDARLQSDEPVLRTHHARDRHTGAVLDKSLFTLEASKPGTRALLRFWIAPDEREETPGQDQAFLDALMAIFASGLSFGGQRARGVGRAVVDSGEATLATYDLGTLSDMARWLGDTEAVRTGRDPSAGSTISLTAHATRDALEHVTLAVPLGIPRGQDVLVGDGAGLEVDVEPQEVVDALGNSHWRLPGSSLRGAFRAWCHRLEALAHPAQDHPVADSRKGYDAFIEANGRPPRGEELGWCYDPEKIKSNRRKGTPITLPPSPGAACRVAGFFGSLHQRGRVLIADAMAPKESLTLQTRRHVAVDRISGGAVEGLLFDSMPLIDAGAVSGPTARWHLHIVLKGPLPHEIEWIARCLKALDLGLIRVGSAKSSGRIAVAGAISVEGHEETAHEVVAGLSLRGFTASVEGREKP